MFGLMRAKTCSLPDELKHHRRLHYCGTCKTMGSLYGQRARALLNHDTVFLAEILTALSTDNEELRQWDRAYQSFNCLALPKTPEVMPIALQLAASATVVLTEFKLADHINDSSRLVWKGARRFFSKSFRRAAAKLRAWQFPLAELEGILKSQEARETSSLASDGTADEILHDLAEPTATATAMFFQHGARLVGKSPLEQAAYALGYAFGELAYLLDAFEDYEKDFRKGEFNALRVAYKINGAELPAEIRRAVKQRLRALGIKIQSALYELPMPEAMAAMYASRLQANLSNKLGGLPLLHIHQPGAKTCATRLSISERWRNAVSLGRELRNRHRDSHPASIAAKFAAPFIFASVLPVAFFAPNQAATASSYRECLSMSLNLMFFGSVIASTAAMANSLIFSAPDNLGGAGLETPPGVGKGKGRRRGGAGDGNSRSGCSFCCCDGSCCDCCDCCEGCDGCNCCDCGDCCSGCDCGGCCDCDC